GRKTFHQTMDVLEGPDTRCLQNGVLLRFQREFLRDYFYKSVRHARAPYVERQAYQTVAFVSNATKKPSRACPQLADSQIGIPMIPRGSADSEADPCIAMACVTTSGIGLKTYFRAVKAMSG